MREIERGVTKVYGARTLNAHEAGQVIELVAEIERIYKLAPMAPPLRAGRIRKPKGLPVLDGPAS